MAELRLIWKTAVDRAEAHASDIHEAERRVIEAAKEWAAGKNGKALISCDDMPLVKAVRALQEAERA